MVVIGYVGFLGEIILCVIEIFIFKICEYVDFIFLFDLVLFLFFVLK